MKRIPLYLTLLAVLALPQGAFAQSAPVKPPPLLELEKSGAMVKYLGKEQGLDGWMTVKGGQIEYMYSTPDQQGLILGVMFDAKGDSVTARQLKYAYENDPDIAVAVGGNPTLDKQGQRQAAEQAQTPNSGKPKSEQLWDRLAASHNFTIGKPGTPSAYVFIDPQCPHCKDFLRSVRDRKYLETHSFKVIPLSITNMLSVQMAAALLESKTPEAQLWGAVDGNKDAIPVSGDPEKTDTAKVRDNLQIMLDYKLDVTPLIIYRGADGKVKLVKGGPTDLPAMIADIR
jgi:protein-disulfide isomerase